MGVPAFYRWLSEKYPKVVQDILEERVPVVPGTPDTPMLPFDWSKPNPSGLECDNLYLDLNGIIHPCSHPENGPQPTTEVEMYENVCEYVDRLLRVIRPRKLLYVAIDGVAPRAKMNQQRSRRFRSAQEARDLRELENQIRVEMDLKEDDADDDAKQQPGSTPGAAWDSNVITPGTPFMLNLSNHLRFYIRKRLSTNKNWKQLRVLYSDASCPGEGEHKIMTHVRLQRSQPGYDPNLVHVLHGLDADLIMLALATHEAHFYISRELVTFGRRSEEEREKRQQESGFADAQKALDDAVGDSAMTVLAENRGKPLQRVAVPILREYWQFEFADCLDPTRLPFAPNFERLVDDVVFLCFFVGNDFLPHLPSLDIRDGALDYLFNIYKRLLPSLGDYITSSGGVVNLSLVDVILAEVGSIEDYVFRMKHDNEQRMAAQQRQHRARNGTKGGAPPPPPPPGAAPAPDEASRSKVRGRAARILEANASGGANGQGGDDGAPGGLVALSRNHQAKEKARQDLKRKIPAVQQKPVEDNLQAAQKVKELLMGGHKDASAMDTGNGNDDAAATKEPEGEGAAETVAADDIDANDYTNEKEDAAMVIGENDDDVEEADVDEDDVDDDDDKPEIELHVKLTDEEAAAKFKERVKAEQQLLLDDHAKNVEDKVRLHEEGWKDRYYSDKCKADDVENHGGREHLFRSYVVGLCWVMKYYYDGCPSWKWYFPFHYAPFASDLRNIERFAKDVKALELNTPFNPVEQLMAVLPSDSAHAVPKPSRWLMLDEESPIIDFYPSKVPVDPNGKAMPWLWVVLLPFIDEDRLLSAMSPTMAHWKKEELLCNARGLDDGYLYAHKAHPLSRKLLTVLDGGKTAKAPKVRLTDSAAYGTPGFSGSLRPPLSHEIFDEASPIPPPSSSAGGTDAEQRNDGVFGMEIMSNDAVCVAFSEPPKLSHKSILLPGSRNPAPVLTADDRRIRRPRLNRGGGTIANLGTGGGGGQSHQSGYGSMNISSYERQLAERTGRGGQMYQPGTRAWGAMEPTPKRVRAAAGVNIPNPFSSQPYPNAAPQYQQPWSNQQQQQQRMHQQPPQTYGNPYAQQSTYSQQQPYHQQMQQRQAPQYQQQSQQWQGNASYQQHGPPHHHTQQQRGGGYQQQQQQHPQQRHPPSNYPSHGQQQQQQHYPPHAPPGQGPGFNFRSFNSNNRAGPPGQQPRPPPTHQQAAAATPASADVMRNLKAQLSSTLNQSRQRK
jgi:5'-3' exoribonuclease 2